MRFIVHGAGAVGGVVGAQLHRAGNDVTLVARSSHYETIRDRGLVFESPLERIRLQIPITDRVAGFDFTQAIVVLVVNSNDTAGALADLRGMQLPVHRSAPRKTALRTKRWPSGSFPMSTADLSCARRYLDRRY